MTRPTSHEAAIQALNLLADRLDKADKTGVWTPEVAYIIALGENIQAALDGRPAVHEAMRGSDVEAWLKRHREAYREPDGTVTGAWHAIDGILDDYRDHADTGTPLSSEVQGPAWL
ncbi:hypothetical protein [Actinoplanes rectilineatus]|uniref:hypothetical protein n=1 Tax=Actinoplanes rectilineatus TaxID=113571 RepID=UPI0005F2C1A8|nr:hypothetical protein [Actinoplanes rectilineatus]